MCDTDSKMNKARKLLNLLNNAGTESEATAASLALQRLLASTGMSMADIENAEETDQSVEYYETKSVSKLDPWERRLATVVAKNYRCDWLRHSTYTYNGKKRFSVKFYGMGEDAQVAASVYKATRAAALKCLRAFKKRYLFEHRWDMYGFNDFSTHHRNSYLFGFVRGLEDAYREQVASDETLALAIVVPTEVKDEIQKVATGTIRSRSIRLSSDASIEDSGYSDGFGVGQGNRMAAMA